MENMIYYRFGGISNVPKSKMEGESRLVSAGSLVSVGSNSMFKAMCSGRVPRSVVSCCNIDFVSGI